MPGGMVSLTGGTPSQSALCLLLAQRGVQSGPEAKNSPAKQGDLICRSLRRDRRIPPDYPTCSIAESSGCEKSLRCLLVETYSSTMIL